MPYVDLNTIHNPATGTIAPASWGDQVRDNLEFLIDPPYCSVFNSAVQNIANNTNVALTANSENFDNNAMHSTVSNTSRMTIQTAGRYQFISTVAFASNGTGLRQILFRIDGTTFITPSVQITAVTGSVTSPLLVANIALNAAQYVECMVRQTSGGALDVTLTEFAAMFVTR